MFTNKLSKAREYFQAFSDQNMAILSYLFSDDVSLLDWEIQAHGRDEVLEANARIFSSVEKISVVVHALAQVDNTVFAEITVCVNHDTKINVVDILTFNDRDQITSVKAYKR